MEHLSVGNDVEYTFLYHLQLNIIIIKLTLEKNNPVVPTYCITTHLTN